MEYLGILGRLVGITCPTTENTSTEDRYFTQTTVEGRLRAQARPFAPRSWSISTDTATPAEIASLVDFTTGAWGNGPFVWVPIQAQRGNLLTPRESVLVDHALSAYFSDAGPVRDSTGAWTPRSVSVSLASGWTALHRGVPVIPGTPVTWTADVSASGTAAPALQLGFYDAAGTSLASFIGTGSGTGMQRVSVTATAPAGATEAWLGVRNTVGRITRPQATWTTDRVPWSAGHGSASVIIDGLSESLIMANSFGTFSDVGFTIMEVS